MKLRGYGLLIFIAGLLCSVDCGVPYMIHSAVTPPHVVDAGVSDTDYELNRSYRLLIPFFVVRHQTQIAGEFPDKAIFPPGYFRPADVERPVGTEGTDMPMSVDDYRRTPDKWPEIVAVLPIGDVIQFKELCHIVIPQRANPLLPGYDAPSVYPLFFVVTDGIGLVNGLAVSLRNSPYWLTIDREQNYLQPVYRPTESP